jgi:hypothetical protein
MDGCDGVPERRARVGLEDALAFQERVAEVLVALVGGVDDALAAGGIVAFDHERGDDVVGAVFVDALGGVGRAGWRCEEPHLVADDSQRGQRLAA